MHPDRVVEGAAVRVREAVAEDLDLDLDLDLDRNRNRVSLDRGRNGSRNPRAAQDHMTAGRIQADPPREEDDQDPAPRQSARVTRDRAAGVVADRDREQGHVVRDPDENRDLGAAPDLAVARGTVTGGNAEGVPHLSGSREQSRAPHHPEGNRVAVPGLCQSRQIGGVVPGRETLPRLTVTTSTRHRAK